MGLDINGGALEWKANIDVDAAFAQLDLLGKKFSKALEVAPNTSIVDLLKGKLEDLTKQTKIFTDGLKNVTEPAAIKQLNAGLTNTKTQISVIDSLLKQLGAGGFKSTGDGAESAATKVKTLRGQLNEVRSELGLMLKQQNEGGPFDPAKFEQLTEKGRELSNAYNNVNKELHLASSNVAGLDALREGFKGLIGSAEAFAGVMGLFTTDQQQAEEITKNLVALMSILNGVEEAGSILAKNSALNAFLRRTALFSQAEGAIAATAAEGALAGAEEAGVVATESATAAQWGLNAAMLANPVGAILLAIVGLIGAWELYTHTIGKASDEEERHRLAAEALQEALKKSAEAIGTEEAAITGLISQAKNENLTREQRQQAIGDLISKYPQYLNAIRLENIYSEQTNTAIQKQIELLKAKAIAQAAEQVYAEKLKKVVEAQNEVNRVTDQGATFFEKFWAAATDSRFQIGEDINLTVIKRKTDDVIEAQKEADATLHTFIQTQTEAGQAMQSGSDKIQIQIDKLHKLGELTGNPLFYKGLLDGLEQQKKILQSIQTKPFDPTVYEKDKALAIATAQAKVDAAQKGSLAELKARIDLFKAEKEQALKNRELFNEDGTPIRKDQSDPNSVNPEALKLKAQLEEQLRSGNEELRAKILQNAVAAANAAVVTLQAIGQAGSDAFFNAQEKVIRKTALEQIVAAKDNAGEILNIQANMHLQLSNLDNDRQRQQIENQKSLVKAQLDIVRIGSQEELDLKLKMIDLSANEELIAAGKNQDKINEINSNAEKAKFDLRKQYAIEFAETETNIRISQIENDLAISIQGSQDELKLKKDLIDQKAALDIEAAQKQITNQELLAAKTREIYSKSLVDKKKLDDDFSRADLEHRIKAIQAQTDLQISTFDKVINDPTSSTKQKFQAEEKKLQAQIVDLQNQETEVLKKIFEGKGNVEELKTQLADLESKENALEGRLQNLRAEEPIKELQQIAAKASALSSALNNISTSLKDINPELADLAEGLSNVGSIASGAISAIASFASGDIAGGIAGVLSTIGGIISSIAGNEAKELAQRKAIQDFMDKIQIGEQEINLLYEERARQQVLINKLRLQGMLDEKALLQQQKDALAKQFTDVFTELQKQSFQQVQHVAQVGITPAFDAIANVSLFGKSFDEIEQLFIKGQLTGKAKDLFDELQKIKQAGVDVDALLQQNKDKADQLFTGTTAQNIADTIRQGLESGKRSAADFADTFQNLMQQAILSSFEAKTIEPLIADFFKQFADLSENNGGNLTADQIRQLKEKFGKDVEQITKQFEQLQQLTGINVNGNGSSSNSLSGALRGMSEQTAELLAGQFGGLRITAMSQLNILTQQMAIQNDIRNNTADTVARLDVLLKNIDFSFNVKGIKIQ
jgi:uncharacterized protein YukE